MLAMAIGAVPTGLSVSAATSVYDTYISVSTQGSGLQIEPAVIYEPSSFADITAAAKTNKPTSVILTPDETMHIKLGEETLTLKGAYDNYVKSRFIPVIRLDGDTVEPFINWLNNVYKVMDIMAVSDDIEVIEELYADKAAGYLVNTVYDLTGETLSSDRYAEWKHIAEANAAGCNILMYDGSDENLPVVAEYVEAMTKVCWAYVEDKAEAVGAIAAGCYGVVGKDNAMLSGSVKVFSENGFARAQYIAAHRGITKYANEQSLTGIMAAHNEGATHVEIDIQITTDRQFVICHNSDSTAYATVGGQRFAKSTKEQIGRLRLKDYSKKYEDSFATLEDVVKYMSKTDVILIVELKIDNASVETVDELKAIEALKEFMDKHPEIQGHWYAITFYSPFAEKMREFLPQIPLGYLGAGKSDKLNAEGLPQWGGRHKDMTDVAGKIEFVRYYNLGLDESMGAATNTTAQNYIARGYTQNTWTFEDTSHFGYKANVATTNKAEDCAMLVKEIGGDSVTAAELEAGKAKFPCTTYNGWQVSKECKILEVERTGDTVLAVLYLEQESDGATFGLYSGLVKLTVK